MPHSVDSSKSVYVGLLRCVTARTAVFRKNISDRRIQPIIAARHGSEFAPVCAPFTMDRGIDLVPNTLS
jgi:hypothetical protein